MAVEPPAALQMTAETAMNRVAIGQVYRNLPSAIATTIAVVWVFVYVLWECCPHTPILIWASALTTFSLVRLAYTVYRIQCVDFLDDPRFEGRMIGLGGSIVSASLSIGFWYVSSHAPVAEQYIVTAISVGVCAGSAVALTGCRFALLAFTVPWISTMAGSMLWHAVTEADSLRAVAGVMLVLYMGGLLAYQRKAESLLLHNIRLRLEKDELLGHKDDLLAELQLLNKELSADRQAFLTASLTDGLTGLANRRHFDDTLMREWDRCRRDRAPFACIIFDIDHFKKFNDRYGHVVGDDCLRTVAGTIATVAGRSGDFAARFGGEEFVVLLPGTDLAGALVLAERIRAMTEECAITHQGANDFDHVTVSAGITAIVPSERFASAQCLVDNADEALYQAKRLGRNRVAVRDLDGQSAIASSA